LVPEGPDWPIHRHPRHRRSEKNSGCAHQCYRDAHRRAEVLQRNDGPQAALAVDQDRAPGCNAEEKPCIQKDCEQCNGATRPRTQAMSLQLSHRIFAHFNQETTKKMVKAQAINCTLPGSKACDYEVCRVSKAKRSYVPTEREQPRDQDLEPLGRVWADVKGKVRRKGHWGSQYIVTFTCEKTRWVYVDFARKKSDIKEAHNSLLE